MSKALLLLPALLMTALPALGHSVWIEPGKDGQLIIRFAEPDGNSEKSPGHLDELTRPVAWLLGPKGPVQLEVQKKSDHFLIVGASTTNSVQAETDFQVMAVPGKPGRLPHFYARWSSPTSEASPALNLDIVPSGKPGEFRVFFRGKPLGGAKATLRTPDEKEQDLTADDMGYIRLESAQKGLHTLSIAHYRETLGGFSSGKAYDLTSHNVSLTWIN